MPAHPRAARGPNDRPYWSQVLRSLRETRGITQDGWASRLGVGRATLQRWEAGELAPGADAEQSLLRTCSELGLYRRYDSGPLRDTVLTAAIVQELLADARLGEDRAPRQVAQRAERAPLAPMQPDTAPVVRPSNLALLTNSFVGRDHDLEALLALLGRARLLTLSGAGGVGKTRLAVHVAAQAPGFADGVWFVDLSSVLQPVFVPQAVAAVLDVREQPELPFADALLERLRDASVLLLLDNCEQIVGAVAQLAARLLDGCPGLRILATSRQPLGLPGEEVWRVASLSLPPDEAAARGDVLQAEAGRLFSERAQAATGAFSLSDAEAPAVARICRWLDGIPLAIELAAARMKALSAEQIAARLGDRFQLLTSGPRTNAPRQQTLRAALDWSYELLSWPEQTLLQRLAVFAGGCAIEAVEAVCSDERLPAAAVLDLIEQLADKSMLIVERLPGAVRYRFLETVRQYADEKLRAGGEAERVQQRHLAWRLAVAEEALPQLQGVEQQLWFDRFERDHDNLRAVLDWSLMPAGSVEQGLRLAVALRAFWYTRGYASEGRRWLARLLAHADHAPPPVRARALDAAAALAHSQGDYPSVRSLLESSLTLWRSLDDGVGTAVALNLLGLVEKDSGDRHRAATILEEALTLMRAAGDQRRLSMVLNNLAAVTIDLGDYARAAALNVESLAIKRASGDHAGVIVSLHNLAEAARLQGDAALAAEYAAEAVALARKLGAPSRTAQSLHVLGVALLGLERGEAAVSALSEALTIFRDVEAPWGIALCCEGLAEAAAHAGIWQRAAILLGAAQALRARLGAPLTTADEAARDRVLAAARAALGEEHCLRLQAEGGALAPAAIVACGLAANVPLPPVQA